MREENEKLARLEGELKAGGGEKSIQKQHESGKLTARERLDLFFDKGTLQETDLFVQHRSSNFGLDKVSIPADGVVTGFGKVNGRTVCAFAQDFTARGGTLGEMHARKICRIMDLAMKMKAPMVGFITMRSTGNPISEIRIFSCLAIFISIGDFNEPCFSFSIHLIYVKIMLQIVINPAQIPASLNQLIQIICIPNFAFSIYEFIFLEMRFHFI